MFGFVFDLLNSLFSHDLYLVTTDPRWDRPNGQKYAYLSTNQYKMRRLSLVPAGGLKYLSRAVR